MTDARNISVSDLPDKSTSQTHWRERSLIKLKASHAAKIDADIGAPEAWEAFLAYIASGGTQLAYSRSNALDNGSLSIYLGQLPPDRRAQLEAARRAAGQSLLDLGMEALEGVNTDSSGAVALARHKEQALARRAGLMNRHLQERLDVNALSALNPTANAIPQFSIQILGNAQISQSNQTLTISSTDSGENLI